MFGSFCMSQWSCFVYLVRASYGAWALPSSSLPWWPSVTSSPIPTPARRSILRSEACFRGLPQSEQYGGIDCFSRRFEQKRFGHGGREAFSCCGRNRGVESNAPRKKDKDFPLRVPPCLFSLTGALINTRLFLNPTTHEKSTLLCHHYQKNARLPYAFSRTRRRAHIRHETL